ncbi:MAG TPA: hypothetical protein VEX13_04560 [Chloroflexia bacterium]|nr:hypothetical protein [Chloroflexia bacterium]
MAKKDKVKELQQKSRFAAMEGLRPTGGFPIPPRKATKEANKASKKLSYPVPPYPGASVLQLYRWAEFEWWRLGRWQRVVAPVMILVALLTWEKERALQDAHWDETEKAQTKQKAAEIYGAVGRKPSRRKLLGIIPLPGKK